MLLPLSGVVDGFGTELGGSAIIMVILKFVHEIWKERKSKLEAVKEVEIVKANNERASLLPQNPEPLQPSRNKYNGQSSTNMILMIVKEHTKQLEEMRTMERVDPKTCEQHIENTTRISKEVTEIRRDLGKVREDLGQVKGRLQN